MVVRSTKFQHLDIGKFTWLSTTNQIDQIVKDRRHVPNVLYVRTFRGLNIDSDHYVVAAKTRLRISASRSVQPSALLKLDIKKLRSQRKTKALSA